MSRTATKEGASTLPDVPLYKRMGWRPLEFAALVGISKAKVWKGIKAGTIPTVEQDGIRIIPRAYAVSKGYLTE
jgi:hypothetical protein